MTNTQRLEEIEAMWASAEEELRVLLAKVRELKRKAQETKTVEIMKESGKCT